MWICSKLGFFSVVFKSGGPVAQTGINLRARSFGDIMNAAEVIFPLLSKAGRMERIITTPEADYRYRLMLAAGQFSRFMRALEESVDYSNFKDTIAETPEQEDKLPVYGAFWRSMVGWQRNQRFYPDADEFDAQQGLTGGQERLNLASVPKQKRKR